MVRTNAMYRPPRLELPDAVRRTGAEREGRFMGRQEYQKVASFKKRGLNHGIRATLLYCFTNIP